MCLSDKINGAVNIMADVKLSESISPLDHVEGAGMKVGVP